MNAKMEPSSPPIARPSGCLSTRPRRYLTFFLLYVTEGIPLGFNAVALATLMRKQGLGPEAIGYFVATLYLPWSFKWLMGPLVDMVYSDRLGRRRAWIVGCQTLMALALLLAMGVDFAKQFYWFTAIILVHNLFAATMDVAIDSLACATLKPEERGAANGLMFAGASLGSGLGGSGVLFVLPYLPVWSGFLLVTGAILLVTGFVSTRLVEPVPETAEERPLILSAAIGYVRALAAAFFGSRTAMVGFLFAILPTGAYGLGLALLSNLAVELGMSDTKIGWLNLWSMILSAAGCIIGGLISDRFGRRRTLAIYVLLTTIPVLWLAYQLSQHDWILPALPTAVPRSEQSELIAQFWIVAFAYAFAQGLVYGTRTAIYMDLTRVEVAATQFTAYMSLMNLALAYSAWWQGRSAERFGYPATLTIDAAFGCLCLIPLVWMAPPSSPKPLAAAKNPVSL